MRHATEDPSMTRRGLLGSATGLAAGIAGMTAGCANDGHTHHHDHDRDHDHEALANPAPDDYPVARNGRIKQSIVHWCFKDYWDVEAMCALAHRLGCKSIELLGPEHFATLKRHGLTCAIVGSHPFRIGMNDPAYQPTAIAKITESIDACAEYGFPSVITFTGYANGISLEDGKRNCIEGYKKIIGYAEKKGVNLCLEHLNTRDDTHDMKGHPGYQGDHVDYCMEIVKGVGSPRMKLLFDIYHVQIMDGDVIRRIRQYGDYIGHIHTAGNPGRGELDDAQEINYPAVMKALLDIKYPGYVGQEFIPTRDALAGLTQAVKLCDV